MTKSRYGTAALLAAAISLSTAASPVVAERKFITIGTGGPTGVYFVTGNAICRMVDASEVGYLTAYLCSDKAWAVTGEVIAAGGGTGNAVRSSRAATARGGHADAP